MTELHIDITVKSVTDAQRIVRILKRKSFEVTNTVDDFRIKP